MNQLDPPSESSLASAVETLAVSQKGVEAPQENFTFRPDRIASQDLAAAELLKQIRKIELPKKHNDGFASERPAGPTITDQDMVDVPIFWGDDVEGNPVFVFVYKDGDVLGLDEEGFAKIQVLIEGVLKSEWARRMLSRSFIEKVVIKWLQSKFNQTATGDLSETIVKASKDAVQPLELWAPIAHLEIQSSFTIGHVEIATITKTMIDALETQALNFAPHHREQTTLLFGNMRKSMQGLAAVVYKAEGEPEKIKEDGEAIARIVVGLLRFFSPAAVSFPMMCASALLGSETVPTSNLLVLGEKTFVYAQAMLSPNPPDWRLYKTELHDLGPTFEEVGALILPEGLSSFALAVRSSLLLFGAGTTFSNPIERLTYTLSSLEALLLRHSAEPLEFNVTERMGLLLTEDRTEREEIARNTHEAYRLRARQDISTLAPHEMGSVATFVRLVHGVISIALNNINRFGTVAEFAEAIERRK